ncbi:MAG: group II intron maturase-specific domain-containing protein [Bacteroidota bacterium]|nr:group II intron maturase-specific domain-containing protein [Bacteroidota bacterium]
MSNKGGNQIGERKVEGYYFETQGFTAAVLIRNLNPFITGWANYHRHVCSKKTFYLLDSILWRNIWN